VELPKVFLDLPYVARHGFRVLEHLARLLNELVPQGRIKNLQSPVHSLDVFEEPPNLVVGNQRDHRCPTAERDHLRMAAHADDKLDPGIIPDHIFGRGTAKILALKRNTLATEERHQMRILLAVDDEMDVGLLTEHCKGSRDRGQDWDLPSAETVLGAIKGCIDPYHRLGSTRGPSRVGRKPGI